MRHLFRTLAIAATALLAPACATRPPIPAEAAATPFLLERDLAGASVARGEFRTITGVRRPFTARLHGTSDGATFTLVEDFEFDDGERDRKTWRFERIAAGRYTGTREDVVGEAQGFQDGDVFRLEYDVVLAGENGRGRKVRFRDVIALRPDGDIVNNASVGWFGLRVGSVSLIIDRAN